MACMTVVGVLRYYVKQNYETIIRSSSSSTDALHDRIAATVSAKDRFNSPLIAMTKSPARILGMA